MKEREARESGLMFSRDRLIEMISVRQPHSAVTLSHCTVYSVFFRTLFICTKQGVAKYIAIVVCTSYLPSFCPPTTLYYIPHWPSPHPSFPSIPLCLPFPLPAFPLSLLSYLPPASLFSLLPLSQTLPPLMPHSGSDRRGMTRCWNWSTEESTVTRGRYRQRERRKCWLNSSSQSPGKTSVQSRVLMSSRCGVSINEQISLWLMQ